MSKYQELLNNPPHIELPEKTAREVVIKVVSCMCDNRYTFTFKRNADGDFKMGTGGFAYSNFQFRTDKDDMEWEADDNNWAEVFFMINKGTVKIEKVKSR